MELKEKVSSLRIIIKFHYIYAKTKAYVEGIYKGSDTDSQSNSSHAGASYNPSKNYWEDGESVGSHKFEHTGYQSWYPETTGT